MRVTGIESRVEQVPQTKRRSLARTDDPADQPSGSISRLIVHVNTDDGRTGIGSISTGQPRIVQTIIEDLFVPQLIDVDPRVHERIYARAKRECIGLTRGGFESMAFAALDIAIWDIKCQDARRPLHQLLGAARNSTLAYFAETIDPSYSADQVIEIAKPMIEQGLAGLWVGVSGRDPIRDANKLQQVRDQLGEEIWFGVCGHHGLDLNTALAFGRFLQEEMDADVYADPCPANDFDTYARLASELEVMVAAGSSFGFDRFFDLSTRTPIKAWRVDVERVGGITPLLKIAALAETNHRMILAQGNIGVTTELGCALPAVTAVDFDRRTGTSGNEPWKLADGQVCPPAPRDLR